MMLFSPIILVCLFGEFDGFVLHQGEIPGKISVGIFGPWLVKSLLRLGSLGLSLIDLSAISSLGTILMLHVPLHSRILLPALVPFVAAAATLINLLIRGTGDFFGVVALTELRPLLYYVLAFWLGDEARRLSINPLRLLTIPCVARWCGIALVWLARREKLTVFNEPADLLLWSYLFLAREWLGASKVLMLALGVIFCLCRNSDYVLLVVLATLLLALFRTSIESIKVPAVLLICCVMLLYALLPPAPQLEPYLGYRSIEMKATLQKIVREPLLLVFGQGLGRYNAAAGLYPAGVKYDPFRIHNSWLQMLVHSGLFGFAVTLATFTQYALRATRAAGFLTFAEAMLLSNIGQCFWQIRYMSLIGFLMGYEGCCSRENGDLRAKRPTISNPRSRAKVAPRGDGVR